MVPPTAGCCSGSQAFFHFHSPILCAVLPIPCWWDVLVAIVTSCATSPPLPPDVVPVVLPPRSWAFPHSFVGPAFLPPLLVFAHASPPLLAFYVCSSLSTSVAGSPTSSFAPRLRHLCLPLPESVVRSPDSVLLSLSGSIARSLPPSVVSANGDPFSASNFRGHLPLTSPPISLISVHACRLFCRDEVLLV